MGGDQLLFLQEKTIPFSIASVPQQVIAGVLGALNLGGAIWLGNLLNNYQFVMSEPVLASTLSKVNINFTT